MLEKVLSSQARQMSVSYIPPLLFSQGGLTVFFFFLCGGGDGDFSLNDLIHGGFTVVTVNQLEISKIQSRKIGWHFRVRHKI